MDARAEQASLREDPLPPVVIINPLTRVWDIDGQIAALQEQINELQQARTEALDYAIREQIAEDENCRLDRKVRRIRSLDPGRFREVFPEEYRMACELERKEKAEALEHIGEKIPLGLADKLVKKVVLDAAQGVITVKETESFSVVRK